MEREVSKHSRELRFERRTRSDRISGKKVKARENMQQATMRFRDKSICRRVKFADTSFVAVLDALSCSDLSFSFLGDVHADIRAFNRSGRDFAMMEPVNNAK